MYLRTTQNQKDDHEVYSSVRISACLRCRTTSAASMPGKKEYSQWWDHLLIAIYQDWSGFHFSKPVDPTFLMESPHADTLVSRNVYFLLPGAPSSSYFATIDVSLLYYGTSISCEASTSVEDPTHGHVRRKRPETCAHPKRQACTRIEQGLLSKYA